MNWKKAAAAAAVLCACAPEEAPRTRAIDLVDPSKLGWITADAPGESVLVYRSAPNAQFVLSCDALDDQLKVVAPAPLQSPSRRGDKATLYLGGTSFETLVDRAADAEEATVTLQTELTDQALDALRRAYTVRIVFRDDTLTTGSDGNDALASFAEKCAALAAAAQED